MAITVHPAEGLINRLLQQNGREASAKPRVSGGLNTAHDSVNISGEARHQAQQPSEAATARLENQLLQMYTRHGNAS